MPGVSQYLLESLLLFRKEPKHAFHSSFILHTQISKRLWLGKPQGWKESTNHIFCQNNYFLPTKPRKVKKLKENSSHKHCNWACSTSQQLHQLVSWFCFKDNYFFLFWGLWSHSAKLLQTELNRLNTKTEHNWFFFDVMWKTNSWPGNQIRFSWSQGWVVLNKLLHLSETISSNGK
jgi:hypothetical protein